MRRRGLSRRMLGLIWYYTSGYPGVSREIERAWAEGRPFLIATGGTEAR